MADPGALSAAAFDLLQQPFRALYHPTIMVEGPIFKWRHFAPEIILCAVRWYLIQYDPFKDEWGRVIRWYATSTNIDERKKTEERLRNENLVLREQIDRTSMFEEIVGSSKPMRQLVRHTFHNGYQRRICNLELSPQCTRAPFWQTLRES